MREVTCFHGSRPFLDLGTPYPGMCGRLGFASAGTAIGIPHHDWDQSRRGAEESSPAHRTGWLRKRHVHNGSRRRPESALCVRLATATRIGKFEAEATNVATER